MCWNRSWNFSRTSSAACRRFAVTINRSSKSDALAERVGTVLGVGPEGLEVDQLGLRLADHRLHGPRGQALLVEAELGRDHLHEAPAVGVVVDGEARAVPQAVAVHAQDAQAGRVEGGDPHLLGRVADKVDDARPHLVGRLVGEGDGEDAPGRRVTGGEQVGDAPRQHPGLARARARHDQQRPTPVLDGRPLRQGQVVEERGRVAGERAGLGGRAPAAAAAVVGALGVAGIGLGIEGLGFLVAGSRTGTGVWNSRRRRPDPLVGLVEEPSVAKSRVRFRRRPLRTAPAAPRRHGHSHSIVPGGLDVTSKATRFTPSTSLMMREAMRSTRS
jgi:hypothetical protein